jgi:outer membrane protein TolC
MRKLIIAGALLCGIAVKSYAQQASPDTGHTHNYSLAECISYAYQHQDSVVNAGLDVKSAGYKVKETIGQGLPQISGTAQFQDYLRLPVTLVDVSSFEPSVPKGTLAPFKLGLNYQTTAALNLTQKIFDGNYLVGVKASKTYKELYERSLTRSRIEANVSVTKAYYQVLVSDEQIKLLDANIKQLKQQLDQTTAENKQGLAEQIDVQRLTVQYNNLVTSRDNTVRLLELNNELLKFQMGMAITDELTLTDKLENINFNDAIANSSDTSFYHNRIEYSLLETQKRLNEYDLKSKKAQYLPSLSAFANYGTSFQNNSFGNLYSANYPSSYIGLTLNVPIFSGFQHLNQVRESKIAIIKTENDLFNLRNGIGLQANKARITYINGLQSLKSQKENMGLAEEVLRVAKIKYSQGVGSSIEVTQAQTDLDSADNSYIQSLYDALVSKVDLDQAYGRIQ